MSKVNPLARPQKYSLKDIQEYALSQGTECLSIQYDNVDTTKLLWRCAKGHTKYLTFTKYKDDRYNRCKECPKEERKNKNIQKILTFCLERGLACLNIEAYISDKKSLKFRCEKQHEWSRCWNELRIDSDCKICKKESKRTQIYTCGEAYRPRSQEYFWEVQRKQTRQKIEKFCKEYSIDVLNLEEYYGIKSKLMLLCNKGHEFTKTWNALKSHDFCEFCNVETKNAKMLERAKAMAEANKGMCLSDHYTHSGSRMKWKCRRNHTFESPFSTIRQGAWCPTCPSSVSQNTLSDILQSQFPDKLITQNVRRLSWMRSPDSKRILEIDIALFNEDGSIFLLAEYDGKQHYKTNKFFGGQQAFEKSQVRDKIKNELLEQNKDKYQHFVRFTYKDKITKENVLTKLAEHGII